MFHNYVFGAVLCLIVDKKNKKTPFCFLCLTLSCCFHFPLLQWLDFSFTPIAQQFCSAWFCSEGQGVGPTHFWNVTVLLSPGLPVALHWLCWLIRPLFYFCQYALVIKAHGLLILCVLLVLLSQMVDRWSKVLHGSLCLWEQRGDRFWAAHRCGSLTDFSMPCGLVVGVKHLNVPLGGFREREHTALLHTSWAWWGFKRTLVFTQYLFYYFSNCQLLKPMNHTGWQGSQNLCRCFELISWVTLQCSCSWYSIYLICYKWWVFISCKS